MGSEAVLDQASSNEGGLYHAKVSTRRAVNETRFILAGRTDCAALKVLKFASDRAYGN
jgi:hypothetical protein